MLIYNELRSLRRSVKRLETQLTALEAVVAIQGKSIAAVQLAVVQLRSVSPVAGILTFSTVTTHNKEHVAMTTVHDSDPPFTAKLVLDDALGIVTTPDTPPVWVADDNGAFVTYAVAPDGLSAVGTIVSSGTSNITITVTDTNGTVFTIPGQVVVEGGEPTSGSLVITPGVPVVTPPPA